MGGAEQCNDPRSVGSTSTVALASYALANPATSRRDKPNVLAHLLQLVIEVAEAVPPAST